MRLSDLYLTTTINQLKALLGQLDKAAATAGDEADALLERRIAPDMFPLAGQLWIAAFQAQEPLYRLTDRPLPEALVALRTRGAGFGGGGSVGMAEARALIAETVAELETADRAAIDGAEAQPIALDLPMGMVFDFDGATYVRDWAMPQIGFHTNAAYMILRAAGVPLGKRDMVPHMFAYLRPSA